MISLCLLRGLAKGAEACLVTVSSWGVLEGQQQCTVQTLSEETKKVVCVYSEAWKLGKSLVWVEYATNTQSDVRNGGTEAPTGG